jgi:two-component system, cell cycle sensor histidine kinase and response regulator CckA
MPARRLLIVDDEPAAAALFKRFLVKAGYAVETAGTAEEALTMFRAHPDFDLILADLTLPGMNGEELVEQLRALRPTLRAIVTSGYPHTLKIANVRFLQKPYLPKALADEIAAMLADAALS